MWFNLSFYRKNSSKSKGGLFYFIYMINDVFETEDDANDTFPAEDSERQVFNDSNATFLGETFT